MKELEPSELIYGEVSYEGYGRIIELVKATKSKTFVDVGSGFGKVCTFVNQVLNIDCVGIEINEKYHNIAIESSYTPNIEKLNFYCKDFRDPEMLKIINEADFVFANAIMFSKDNFKILMDNCKKILLHNVPDMHRNYDVKIPVTFLKGDRKQTYYFIDKRIPV